MLVEPHGLGWLRFADEQLELTLRASYISDVLASVVGVMADVAEGAVSAETRLGLEPGEATLRIERRGGGASVLTLDVVSGRSGTSGSFAFPVPTSALPRLGLDLAASVDRETYLDSWAPHGSWPVDAVDRLERVRLDQ